MDGSYLAAIKGFEGFAPRAQWDYAQHTNGYGTKALHPGEVIDRSEADRRFAEAISRAEQVVEQHAPGLDGGTKAALTSLTYNAGSGWTKSGLGAAVAAGDMDRARDLFVQYAKAGGEVLPGLMARRVAEVQWIDGAASAAGAEPVIATAQPAAAAQASLGARPVPVTRSSNSEVGLPEQVSARIAAAELAPAAPGDVDLLRSELRLDPFTAVADMALSLRPAREDGDDRASSRAAQNA